MREAYEIITTDAYILHTRATGEADRVITALTKEKGILHIYARSIRKEKAKMRNATRPYGKVLLSAIIGKRNILKDVKITDTLKDIWCEEKKYVPLVNLLITVRSLIPITEIQDEKTFLIVENATTWLKKTKKEHANSVLLVAQVMLLKALGYVEDENITPNRFGTILQDVTKIPEKEKELKRYLKTALEHQRY